MMPLISDFPDPPAIYDHDYPKPMLVTVRPLAALQEACHGIYGPPPAGKIFLGCAVPGNGACWVLIPAIDGGKVTREDQLQVYRHERAHCNGWPADHAVPKSVLAEWPWPTAGQSDQAK